jgi:hypothetical protein
MLLRGQLLRKRTLQAELLQLVQDHTGAIRTYGERLPALRRRCSTELLSTCEGRPAHKLWPIRSGYLYVRDVIKGLFVFKLYVAFE